MDYTSGVGVVGDGGEMRRERRSGRVVGDLISREDQAVKSVIY